MNLKNKLTGLKEIVKFDNWVSIIFRTLFKPHSQLFIYKLKGKEYLINKNAGDVPGFRSILASNEYRPFINELKNIGQISLLDLGANVGGFIALLDSMNIKLKKIVAVEYNPNTFYRLGVNISNNFNCEYHLLNKAVVGYDRAISKNFTLGGTGDSIYENNLSSDGTNKTIPGITFDKIYNQYFADDEIIDLLKIDIEGAEYEIFENVDYKQIKNCKYLLIEIHRTENKNKDLLISKLKELSFEEYLPNTSKNQNVYFFKNISLVN